jgi:hypothetical protein
MTLAGIKPDDLVRIERNGEPSYHARVVEIGPGDWTRRGEVKVITLAGKHYRIVTARQIAEHWRKRRTRVA